MRNRKFIIGFLIFDVVAVLTILIILVAVNPFKKKVAPNTDPTTPPSTTKATGPVSNADELDDSKIVLFTEKPNLAGLREEFQMTDDQKYYTSYKADLDLDMDGDGQIESISISLDEPSESFYVLVNDNGALTDYVVPGHEFGYKEQYAAKACKGTLRAYTMDLNSSDSYQEICIELMRDNWAEYASIMIRYDGTSIHSSVIPGMLSGVSNQGQVQFSIYDAFVGKHKMYKTYDITAETDFLQPQTDYYFVDTNVERTSFNHILDFDLACTNLAGEATVITVGTSFYWSRTDNATYVDVIGSDNCAYRLPVTSEVIEYESGAQTVYKLGDHYAADVE